MEQIVSVVPSLVSSSSLPPLQSLECEHPLENIAILQELFQYCSSSFNSVKTIRLVSKTWKSASASLWNSHTVPFRILVDEKGKLPENLQEEATTSQLSSNKNASKRKQTRHYFLVEKWQVWSLENENTLRFWTQYGAGITTLTLKGCRILYYSTLFPSCFLHELPNMERLNLLDCVIILHGRSMLEHEEMRKRVKAERECVRNKYSLPRELSDGEQEEMEKRIRDALGLSFHGNLKSIRFHNVLHTLIHKGDATPIPWYPLLVMFPNLEHISLYRKLSRQAIKEESNLFGALDGSRVARRLNTLDCLEYLALENADAYDDYMGPISNTGDILGFKWEQLTLTKLSLDLGLRARQNDLQRILESQCQSLQVLRLFRLPLKTSFSNFPCTLVMPQLKELHLFGNPCFNFDFLEFTPKLKVLKWNTSFYDESSHGSRLHEHIDSGVPLPDPLFDEKLVGTVKLGADFKLDCMETLELICGPTAAKSWKQMGKWFPNLKNLNGVVEGDEEFIVIGQQWSELESIEMAHGTEVSAKGILDALLTQKLFQKLQCFTWNSCACFTLRVEEKETGIQVESLLKQKLGNNFTVPWKCKGELGAPRRHCLQFLYEKALLTGGTTTALDFRQALIEERKQRLNRK